MFDAYTVKKVLPRLVIAVILIQLSWFIFTGMIFLTESIAYGAEALIYAPFGNAQDFTFQALFSGLFTGGGFDDVSTLFYSLIIAGGAVASFGGSIVIFALMALLALFVGVLSLLIRRIMLILLLVISPLALVAWILPNTERFWKMWWDNFTKLLLMYPIILVMIAVGRVMAKLGGDFGEQSIATAMVLGGVFLPLALIPKTFGMAGSAFAVLGGTLANRATGVGKGFAARGRKRGSERWKQRGQNAAYGNFFKKGNQDNWRGRANRGLAGAANVRQAGLNPTQWRTNMRTALNDASDAGVGEYSEKSAAFAAIKGDDAKLWAARHTDRGQIAQELEQRDAARFAGPQNRARREEAVSQILRAQKETQHGTFQRARLRAQAKTGTGYQDAHGNFNAAMMMRDVNEVYGNDRNGAGSAIAGMRNDLAQSGQIAGQAGFATWAEQAENLWNGSTSDIDAHNAIMDDTIDSVSPGNAIYGKPSSAAAVAQAHARRIEAISNGIATGANTQDDLDAALAATAGLLDVMSGASPQNASAFANQLMQVQVPHGPIIGPNGQPAVDPSGQPLTGANMSVRDLMEERMNNEEYRTRRKDWGAVVSSQAAAEQAQRAQEAAARGGTLSSGPAGGVTPGLRNGPN